MQSRTLLASILTVATLSFANAQEIPVSLLTMESGGQAFAGVPLKNGIHLAIEEANQKGVLGAAKIKLIDGDYAADKTQLISLATQAIKRDKVVMALGPIGSPDTLAVAPVFNEGKTPFFALATSDRVLDTGPYTFKSEVTPAQLLADVGKYIIEKTKIRKVSLVFQTTNDAQIEMKDVFAKTFKEGGGTVISEDGVAPGESNFLPLATKILSQNVEGVFIIINAEQAANLMVQLRQGGLAPTIPFIGSTSIVSPRVLTIAGRAAEGTIAQAEYHAGQPQNKALEDAYKKRFNMDMDSYGGLGYSMGVIAVQAIKNAGPNPTAEKVREAFMKLDTVAVPAGRGVWGMKDRKPVYESVIVTVKDGKYVAAP